MKTISLFTKLTLEQLLELCKREEPKAQKELYRRYSGRFYAICMRYLREQSEAEDAMIIAFTKIFDKLDQYRQSGNFEAWMRRIVVNHCLSQLEKRRQYFIEIESPATMNLGTAEVANSILNTEDLLQLVRNLPTGYRTVFNLFAIEGYSHKEIASRLGISESTSKTQYLRAKEQLQFHLKRLHTYQCNIC
jgi:RNA polymerase sigma factor (sigma-70 family)